MKNILKISAAALGLLLSSCIKDATPTEIAPEDQATLETMVRGIPAALVQAGSAGYANDGQAWDFALPAIHLATESMTATWSSRATSATTGSGSSEPTNRSARTLP